MSRLVKRTFLFLSLTIALSYLVSYFISENFSTETKPNWVRKIHGYNLDYAIIGSSRVVYVVDIRTLDSAYGRKGINIGTSGSNYAENYLVLSEFLSKNNISTLLLNSDELCFDSKKNYRYPFHDYEFLPLVEKYPDIYWDFVPHWKYCLWRVLPLSKYIEFNKNFTLRDQSLIDPNMGSNLMNDTIQYKYLVKKSRKSRITSQDIKYFLKILDLCRNRNIKVILITTPIYCSIQDSYNCEFRLFIDSISRAKGIPYIGFEDLIEIRKDLFNDSTHTNKTGTIIYSRNLGMRLREL